MNRMNLRWRRLRLWPLVAGILLGPAFLPSPALAIIPHWDPRQAFFIRQFSYLFFMIAMLYFIYELRQGRLQQRGFRLLVWASAFFALWNLDCFIGQLFALYYETHSGMANFGAWVTYVAKLDHLLLVPAFIFFYLGIRALRREQEVGEP